VRRRQTGFVARWSGRRSAVVIALVVVLAAGVGVWWYLHARTDHTTTAVSPAQAVERFRQSTTTTTTPGPDTTAEPSTTAAPSTTTAPATSAPATTAPPVQPAPGVYSYTTTGSDGVDALGGAGHTYPATTTITITANGQCTAQRWTAAEERWDETTACTAPNGVAMTTFVQFHRFFGGDDMQTDVCSDPRPRPLGGSPGATWQVRCTAEKEVDVYTGTVAGLEQASVGGTPVTVEHVVVTVDDGDARDAQRTETWYLAGTDLVVRRISDISTTDPSVLGDVHYTEHYEIALDSLTPLH
jgi:hypothetical protein